MGDPNLNGAQENLFGNYIIQRGLANPNLRDEILAQVANQVSSLFLPVEVKWKVKWESFAIIAHNRFTFIFSSSALGVEES